MYNHSRGVNVILLSVEVIFHKLLTKRNRGLETKKNLDESYVWNILLYSYGSLIIGVWDRNKLKVTEIWIRKRIVRII